MSKHNKLDYLDELEAEAIHILREVAASLSAPRFYFGWKRFNNPVRLAEKASARVSSLSRCAY